jgi:molybdopterin molybdotransferase
MTGAPVPRGTWKVIPQEMCRETDGIVSIPGSVVERGPSRIQGKGSGLRRGARLLQAGECLTPVHIARLADSGVTEIPVFRQPKVSYFCSGSELVDSPAEQGNGQKISSNRYLLAGLIRGFGCRGHDHGGVRDEKSALQTHLKAIMEHAPDIIISTGGMGPGKYDLMEEIFSQCGGKMIFSALKLRPGKSILFGILGHSLYFGLPGPPSAVHALFHVLIRPTLMALQGFRKWNPDMVQAHLKEAMIIGRPGVLRIMEAVLSEKKGIFEVRRSTPKEIADSYLFCPAAKRSFAEKELVSVQPWAPPPFLSVS